MTDRRRSKQEAWEAWRKELFATTTPSERLFCDRMQSSGTIYASAEEYAQDMRQARLDGGPSREFAEMMAEDAARAWTELHGEAASA